MNLKLRIKIPDISEEIIKSIDIDNKTAPKDFHISMKKSGGFLEIDISSDDIGSIISVLEEIFGLISSLKNLEDEL